MKKQKPQRCMAEAFKRDSLTMPYFHNRMITIIGAKAFHGPVRDGKEWFHLAMVVRHNLYNNVVFEPCGA